MKMQATASDIAPPYECFGVSATNPVLFLCDHASNRVPDCIGGGTLGLPDREMSRHIAFDIGARGVAIGLAEVFGGAAICSNFSRLVIDPNRGEDDPTLIMQLYDGTIISGNRHVDEMERTRRLNAFYRPYHKAISDWIDGCARDPVLISIHSFTPRLEGKPPRPWQLGVLSAHDRRLADAVLSRLGSETELTVGDNAPYTGALRGDCMATHGLGRNLLHVLIEIRNDLISDAQGEQAWTDILAPVLKDAMKQLEG